MRPYLPHILAGAGVLLIIAGFFYDVLFAGIPYQGPTPEMSARYAQHSHIAFTICVIGGGALLIGVVAGITQVIIRRFLRTQAS